MRAALVLVPIMALSCVPRVITADGASDAAADRSLEARVDAPVTPPRDSGFMDRTIPPPVDTGAIDVPAPRDMGTIDGPAPPDTGTRDVPTRPDTGTPDVPLPRDSGPPLPAAACTAMAGGGRASTQLPTLMTTLFDRWHEAWLASPAVADLDRDGINEVIVARASRLIAWRPDGTIRWFFDVPGGGRIWASPLVGNFAGDANLEVVVAARGNVYMFNAAGAMMPGFPAAWRDEIRSLAAGDVDGDGALEIVAVTNTPLAGSSQRDIIQVFRGNGTTQPGFPPNTTGTSGCTTSCYVTGGYDQNVAVGPIDGDASWDIFSGQDNAYLSWHRGNGIAFDANPIFRMRNKVLGIRSMLDYALAQQGYANNEAVDEQMHFTNTAPAIADVDADGRNDLVFVGSVQNAAQTDRLRGVALWVLHSDGTRSPTWAAPFPVREYLAGLWDFTGVNIVGLTNQVSIADLDPAVPGLDMVFAGYDGRIHRVGADRRERWAFQYTTANNVLTGGVLIADLSGDGVPEIVFATYSPAVNLSALYVIDAAGTLQHRIALPMHGAMPVPTIADVNRDGTLEIVVSLKDGEDRARSVLVFTVPGSATNCLPWPTGRGNDLRNGYFRASR